MNIHYFRHFGASLPLILFAAAGFLGGFPSPVCAQQTGTLAAPP